MSASTTNTLISSILKSYSPAERNKSKNAILNKVRFELPKRKGLTETVNAVIELNNYELMRDFIGFLNKNDLNDVEFINIYNEARKIVHLFNKNFDALVFALISNQWHQRSQEAVEVYSEFFIDILVAQCKFIPFGIHKLIQLLVPGANDATDWLDSKPSDVLNKQLLAVHKLIERIVITIPMTFDTILEKLENAVPYYKKPAHVIIGYLHNVLWLLEYKPVFMQFVLQLILEKILIVLDVNAPRAEIEETEPDVDEDDDDDDDEMANVAEKGVFEMDDYKPVTKLEDMHHPIAQTLDICMKKLYDYLDTKNANALNLTIEEKTLRINESNKFNKQLFMAFDNVILRSHNTHHVQFLLFYYCSFEHTIAEAFLETLWDKIKNPNSSAVIRQAAAGYIASFLARAKYITLKVLKHYLKELSDWAHAYMQNADQPRTNRSLKAHLVFYTICQAIFYVIAFRSRDLTDSKKNLLFLQSLPLTALVTCHFNPLRVCLPAVATAFAGVMRAYQLAYCHAILERNARRKLATIYTNEVATPIEVLDTFFPFDPYLLKVSGKCIAPFYMQYQASEAEESTQHNHSHSHSHSHSHNDNDNDSAKIDGSTQLDVSRRKRGDSEMIDDGDIDDFLITDKRKKLDDLAKSQERDALFTYGLSPGFHI